MRHPMHLLQNRIDGKWVTWLKVGYLRAEEYCNDHKNDPNARVMFMGSRWFPGKPKLEEWEKGGRS